MSYQTFHFSESSNNVSKLATPDNTNTAPTFRSQALPRIQETDSNSTSHVSIAQNKEVVDVMKYKLISYPILLGF